MDAKAKVEQLVKTDEFRRMKWQRFRSCQAWIGTITYEGITYGLVKSYATIVGLIDYEERKFYELGKYSRTTSKQVTQIYNSMYTFCDRELVAG